MLTSLTTVLIAALAVGGLPLDEIPASVDSGDGLAAIQARADRATDDRIRAIDRALDRVDRNESLTDDHRTTIIENLTADQQAMQELQADIAAETNAAEALTAYRSIFTDYRVLAVTLPQSLYAAGADRLTETAIPRLELTYEALEAASDDAEGLAELRGAIDEATELADGIADAALAIEPSDYNADSTVLAELRLELRQAAAAVSDAVLLANDVRDGLK